MVAAPSDSALASTPSTPPASRTLKPWISIGESPDRPPANPEDSPMDAARNASLPEPKCPGCIADIDELLAQSKTPIPTHAAQQSLAKPVLKKPSKKAKKARRKRTLKKPAATAAT
eukprot:15448646-Alexandrium_andersonii.AAC.1